MHQHEQQQFYTLIWPLFHSRDMKEYLFEGKPLTKADGIEVDLLMIHFKDEDDIHFIYRPHLDLTGYGNNLSEATTSFENALEDFIDYTVKKRTLGSVMSKLGWQARDSAKKPKMMLAPSITSVIGSNQHVSDIFDKYPVETFHKKVGMPAFA